MEIKISDLLFELLNGKQLEQKQNEAMFLMTLTEDGWPHNAMISVGELTAFDKSTLRLALWQGTTTTENIKRNKRALLAAVYKGRVNYVRLSLESMGALPDQKTSLELFNAKVEAFKEDEAKYAEITTGIQISLLDSESVLARWKNTVKAMRKC
ncbi:pyridoxamine 5'-phosphate oxidase family protein [Peribacillus kribbensis]|uniref:pyridoxamine 5'-phosphate oxidase family protein n=1 Tax=Peribacillus kribbensis TaxID=356658 RepID=UPI0003F7A64C|nr:pyridoxamine 5'-phosphate oxidase family protein [Peribacillus kribbensis]